MSTSAIPKTLAARDATVGGTAPLSSGSFTVSANGGATIKDAQVTAGSKIRLSDPQWSVTCASGKFTVSHATRTDGDQHTLNYEVLS